MRNYLFGSIAYVLVVGCGGSDAPTSSTPTATTEQDDRHQTRQSEDDRLNAWFDVRYEELLDFSPMQKTTLGRKENYAEIDDFSEVAGNQQLEWRRETVRELEDSFDYDKLTSEAKMSYDIWKYELERAEEALPFRRRSYIFTQMQGAQSYLPNFLINFHKVDSADDMNAYISRIGGVSRGINQLLDRAKLHADEGVRPPQFAYDGVIKQSKALVSGAPFEGDGDAPIWSDAKSKIAALRMSDKINDDAVSDLEAQVKKALNEEFKPAYDALIAWMETDRTNADEIATGVWKLPEGRARYQQALNFATTTKLTASEIHDLGLAEVARIREDMEKIKEAVGFEGTLGEFFDFVREDAQFYFSNTDEGREEYLQTARDHLAEIDKKLPDYFGLLPKADLIVKRVEAFREQDGAAQHYYPGTPDGSRPGIFYAHLSDMKTMPIPQLEVIAYHEGNPGHHMQISIAQELTGVPEFRTQSFFNAYVEGWALYSELLSKEMGAFKEPYSDFGRLTTEIWRAIRLVVDTGLHDKEWTEEQAVEYFMANSPAAEGQIRSEIQRYIVWPGQATSYKIGMLKILELRQRAKDELGEKFDIAGFHDTVLGGGGLPLNILERRVETWIEAKKAM